MNQISIVIPVHNESENIKRLIDEIAGVFTEGDFEVVVVDDCSTDNTLSILLGQRKKYSWLRVIRNESNLGQSASVYIGVKYAKSSIICTLDGDGQNLPSDLPKMIEVLRTSDEPNLRMVAGWRKNRKDTFWRTFSSKVVNRFRSLILKDNTPDTGCGIKVFYRSTFMDLPFFNHMHRFLPVLVQMQGGKVISIEVGHRKRELGSSHYGTIDRLFAGIIDLFAVCWLRHRSKKLTSKEL